MNKRIIHRFLDREVIILYNNGKELIGYVCNSITPKYKRVLHSSFTTNRNEVKKFLSLI